MATSKRLSNFTFTTVCLAVLVGCCGVAQAKRTASGDVFYFLDEVGIMLDGEFVSGFDVTEDQLSTNPALFENHTSNHAPVLMPDGTTPVRYNDITSVQGTLTVTEVDQGTQVNLDIDGLIPGGLYTVWADFFKAPGFTSDFAHELAAGALGYDSSNPPANPYDFVDNAIRADANGHGELEVIQPAGVTSWFTVVDGFEVPAYVLDPPVAEFHTVLAYHIDGNSWGPRPGEPAGFDSMDDTWVALGGSFVIGCSPPNGLAGDLDGNGEVDFADFTALSESYGSDSLSYAKGDIDCDGAVGFSDFLTLANNYGMSVAGTSNAVPEPNSAACLLPALSGLLLLRRHDIGAFFNRN